MRSPVPLRVLGVTLVLGACAIAGCDGGSAALPRRPRSLRRQAPKPDSPQRTRRPTCRPPMRRSPMPPTPSPRKTSTPALQGPRSATSMRSSAGNAPAATSRPRREVSRCRLEPQPTRPSSTSTAWKPRALGESASSRTTLRRACSTARSSALRLCAGAPCRHRQRTPSAPPRSRSCATGSWPELRTTEPRRGRKWSKPKGFQPFTPPAVSPPTS
jgi:hypothetical protein